MSHQVEASGVHQADTGLNSVSVLGLTPWSRVQQAELPSVGCPHTCEECTGPPEVTFFVTAELKS